MIIVCLLRDLDLKAKKYFETYNEKCAKFKARIAALESDDSEVDDEGPWVPGSRAPQHGVGWLQFQYIMSISLLVDQVHSLATYDDRDWKDAGDWKKLQKVIETEQQEMDSMTGAQEDEQNVSPTSVCEFVNTILALLEPIAPRFLHNERLREAELSPLVAAEVKAKAAAKAGSKSKAEREAKLARLVAVEVEAKEAAKVAGEEVKRVSKAVRLVAAKRKTESKPERSLRLAPLLAAQKAELKAKVAVREAERAVRAAKRVDKREAKREAKQQGEEEKDSGDAMDSKESEEEEEDEGVDDDTDETDETDDDDGVKPRSQMPTSAGIKRKVPPSATGSPKEAKKAKKPANPHQG